MDYEKYHLKRRDEALSYLQDRVGGVGATDMALQTMREFDARAQETMVTIDEGRMSAHEAMLCLMERNNPTYPPVHLFTHIDDPFYNDGKPFKELLAQVLQTARAFLDVELVPQDLRPNFRRLIQSLLTQSKRSILYDDSTKPVGFSSPFSSVVPSVIATTCVNNSGVTTGYLSLEEFFRVHQPFFHPMQPYIAHGSMYQSCPLASARQVHAAQEYGLLYSPKSDGSMTDIDHAELNMALFCHAQQSRVMTGVQWNEGLLDARVQRQGEFGRNTASRVIIPRSVSHACKEVPADLAHEIDEQMSGLISMMRGLAGLLG